MISVVCGVLVRDGDIFLTQRSRRGSYGGMWELPGGKMEGGDETHGQALEREWAEELGVEVQTGVRIHSQTFRLDKTFTVDTYGVTTLGAWDYTLKVGQLDAVFCPPERAVQSFPCMPGFYQSYQSILQYVSVLAMSEGS